MLLTLKPPSQNGIKGPHEYSIVRQSIPTSRTSSTPPAVERTSPPTPAPAPAKRVPERIMDSSRRPLPPPSAMTLPPPEASLSAIAPMGQLPPPPPQWHNADDSMRQWLQSKAEEDRRRQEEEKTRQEGMRVEQRKIEQSMLRECVQAGVPPHLIPLIFAGIGGAASNAALELAHHYISQTTVQPYQTQPPPSQPPPPTLPPPPVHSAHQSPLQPEVRRDSRTIPPNPYGAQASSQAAVSNLPGHSQQTVPASPPQHVYGHGRPASLGTPADPRAQPTSSLSRINTAEMHIHHPPANVGAAQYPPGPPQPPPAMPVKQESQQQTASPSIYFHHWVPPGQSQPNTPSGKGSHDSPYSSHPHAHLRSEYQNSPGRKRKAQGGHQPPPPPSSHPVEASPAMSHRSPRQTTPGGASHRSVSVGHQRQRSDAHSIHESRYQELRENEERASAPRSTPPTGRSSAEREDQRQDTSGAAEDRHGHHESATESAQQSRYPEVRHSEQSSGSYPSYSYSRETATSTGASTTSAPPENRPSEPSQSAMGPPSGR